MKNYITVSILSLLIISCKNDPKNINVTKKDNHLKENIQHDIIIGLYSGVQPSYVMKDKFGDDLVINGKKLTIPSAEYKYFFDKNNLVSLKLTALEENGKSYYYEGNYSVITEDKNKIVLECKIYLKETNSNPIHTITIDKTNKTATEKGDDDSEVELKYIEKIKND